MSQFSRPFGVALIKRLGLLERFEREVLIGEGEKVCGMLQRLQIGRFPLQAIQPGVLAFRITLRIKNEIDRARG